MPVIILIDKLDYAQLSDFLILLTAKLDQIA